MYSIPGSFAASISEDSHFYEEDKKGEERYIDWFRKQLKRDPKCAVHISDGNQVIG